MSDNTKRILIAISLFLAFSLGTQVHLQPKVKTKETIKTDAEQETNKNTQTHRVSTTVKTPDGTVKTVVTVDTDTTKKTNTKENTLTQIQQSIIPQSSNKVNVSALIGFDIIQYKPTYGVSVSKPLLGPIVTGLWALNNGTVGISIGLEF